MRPEFRTCLGALKRQRSPMRERISAAATSRFLASLASLSLSFLLSFLARISFPIVVAPNIFVAFLLSLLLSRGLVRLSRILSDFPTRNERLPEMNLEYRSIVVQ